MLLALHRRARNLGAVLFLVIFAWSLGALAQGGDGVKPDAAGCEAREIAAAIRGCTALIETGGLAGAKLAQAHFNRGKAYAKRSYLCGGPRRFQPGHRTRSQACQCLSRARPELCTIWPTPARADADLAEAIRLAPNDPENYAHRGWFRKGAGDKEAAKADFEQAIKLADKAIEAKQDAAGALRARSDAYAGIEDYGRSLADLEEALDLKPEDESTLCGSRRDLQPQRRTGQGCSRFDQGS